MKKETMLTYVEETPEVICKNLRRGDELTRVLVEEYIEGGYTSLWIVASGSSSNGSWCARPFMRRVLGEEVKIVNPFTFVHNEHDMGPKELVVVVSQSGYSANAIGALKLLRKMGRKTIGLTGNPQSDMREECELLIDYGPGEEKVGYVTKGVTSLALFFMLFSLYAAEKKGRMGSEEKQKWLTDMENAAEVHHKIQERTEIFYQKNWQRLTAIQNAYVCGSGAGYGVALEGALKIGETVQVPSFAYETEEFVHGPNLQLTPNYTVFMCDCGGSGSERTRQIYCRAKMVSERVYLISREADEDDEQALKVDGDLPELLMPLTELAFFQIISYRITEDLHRWRKHPLARDFANASSAKTENYVSPDIM